MPETHAPQPATSPDPGTTAKSGVTTPFSLPTGLILARGVAPPVAVGALGAVVGGLLSPGGWMSGALGGLAAAIGILVGVLVTTPWKPRPVTVWPAMLLGGQGAGFVAALVAGLLLYSASRPGEPLVFGAALAVGLTAGLLSVASLFGRIVANRGP